MNIPEKYHIPISVGGLIISIIILSIGIKFTTEGESSSRYSVGQTLIGLGSLFLFLSILALVLLYFLSKK